MNLAELGKESIKKYGEYVSLIYEDREYTNVELDQMAGSLAGALTAMGVNPGDRLAMLMGNSPEMIVAFGAAHKLGAWPMPVLFTLQAEEIAHVLDDSGAEVCLVNGLFLPKLLESKKLSKKDTLKHIVTCDVDAIDGYPWIHDLIEDNESEFDIYNASDDDVAYLLYTSGTTGLPKGVMLTHGGTSFVSKTAMGILGFKPGDVTLGALPMNHSFGISSKITGMISGAKNIVLSWFDAGKALEMIEKYKINHTGVVPTMMNLMLNHPDAKTRDTSSMRTWVVGAAPLPLEVYKQFENTFGGRVAEGYGMTESSPGGTMNRLGETYKTGSAGPAIPGTEIKIIDESGKDLPVKSPGEILMKGPHIMKGYYNQPEATAHTVVDGWLHTGDVGHLDEDGYLFITERIKDMIIRGGENIYPRDIEEVLFEHPKIDEASVVGKKDPIYGEDVLAIVVKKPGEELTEEEVMEYAAGKLAKFQKPKWVVFVDSLPKTPIGKVLKRELRALYGQQDK